MPRTWGVARLIRHPSSHQGPCPIIMIFSLVESTHCVLAACIIWFMSHKSPADIYFHFPWFANELKFKQERNLARIRNPEVAGASTCSNGDEL